MFGRKNKVPLPGIKTWYGKQVMVTPEELAQYEKENAELEELLRRIFTTPLGAREVQQAIRENGTVRFPKEEDS